MSLWRRANRNDGPDPDTCEHVWRVREVTSALQGGGVWRVCDRCGATRLDEPEEIAGPATDQVGGPDEVHVHTLRRVGSSSVRKAHVDGWKSSHARAS